MGDDEENSNMAEFNQTNSQAVGQNTINRDHDQLGRIQREDRRQLRRALDLNELLGNDDRRVKLEGPLEQRTKLNELRGNDEGGGKNLEEFFKANRHKIF